MLFPIKFAAANIFLAGVRLVQWAAIEVIDI